MGKGAGTLDGKPLPMGKFAIYWFQNGLGLRKPEKARPIWLHEVQRWRTGFINFIAEYREDIVETLKEPLDPKRPVLQIGDDWRTPIGSFFINYIRKMHPYPTPVYVGLRRSYEMGVMRQVCATCLRPCRKRFHECHQDLPDVEPMNQELINYGWAFTTMAYDAEREIMLAKPAWHRNEKPVFLPDFDPRRELVEEFVDADVRDPARIEEVNKERKELQARNEALEGKVKELEEEVQALRAQITPLGHP